MMNAQVAMTLIGLLWMYFLLRFWDALRRDAYRSDIRDLRDGLFDFMWKTGLSFDAPAYREARQVLNGLLRLSRRLSVIRFLLILSCAHPEGRPPRLLFECLPSDSPLRREIARVLQAASQRTVRFVFHEGASVLRLSCVKVIAWVIPAVGRWRVTLRRWIVPMAKTCGTPHPSPELAAIIG